MFVQGTHSDQVQVPQYPICYSLILNGFNIKRKYSSCGRFFYFNKEKKQSHDARLFLDVLLISLAVRLS